MRQAIFGVVLGLVGAGVLVSLGVWQLRRLEWKETIIAQADAMIAQAPVPLPATPDPATDRYRPVEVEGRFTGDETFVLTSTRERGPGFLVIAAFETEDGRRILIDRGYVPETEKNTARPGHATKVIGNLNWPDDVTSGTPAHDTKTDIWFGRDVAGMAAQLATDPILVIARAPTGDGITPMPATAAFKNDHLGYAVTWFGLAIVWVGMTLGFLWRIRRRTL